MLRNYNPILRVDVVETLSIVDYGDVPTVPGSTADSLERSASALAEVVSAGATTICLGGDHTILLAELRAMASWLGLERVEIGARGDLAPALQFLFDRRLDQLVVPVRNHRLDCHAILGRRFDDGHIPQPQQRHV